MITLGGNVVVRNVLETDFPYEECIKSLLPVCDLVVVCDAQSTDGTQEKIRDWMLSEPKLRLCVYPWVEPVGNIDWFVNWLNYARVHIPCDFQFQLDCDEVIHENSYDEILRFKSDGTRKALICDRFNFWKDHRHVIPPGVCLSHKVVRIAPTDVWLPSDGAHEKGAEAVAMAVDSTIQIFHYGFIQKREGYFKKEKLIQKWFFNHYDDRLVEAEKKPGNWMTEIQNLEWRDQLVEFNGEHPAVAIKWLEERNYPCQKQRDTVIS